MADEEEKQEKQEKQEEQEGEASTEEEQQEGGEEKKGGISLKLILLIGVPIVVIVLTVVLLFVLGVFGGSKEDEDMEAPKELTMAEKLENIYIFKLPNMLVNLKSKGSRTNFMKLAIGLEVEGPQETEQQLNVLKPRIIDQFQIYLRELEVEDLQGSAGLQRLREELLERANAVTKPIKIVNVLFIEMLVQ